MSKSKFVGYALLITGLALMFYSLISVFIVFTGGSQPPKVLIMNDITTSLPMDGTITIFEGDALTFLINSLLWYTLMFFTLTAGEKIASLGAKIIREIKVEVKSED